MAFLAKGNTAQPVSMSACCTLMAPFVSLLARRVLAGRQIESDSLP